MPWETDGAEGKYKYYPQGDVNAAPKDAPSAINVVVVPDVNLPKVRLCISRNSGRQCFLINMRERLLTQGAESS